MPSLGQLGRRERQIMDVVIRLGRASANDVRRELPDAPAGPTVRTMLRILEHKGFLRHAQDGPRFVYFPATNPRRIRTWAVRHLLHTFFDDSLESAVAALLGHARRPATDAELKRVEAMIAAARRRPARRSKPS